MYQIFCKRYKIISYSVFDIVVGLCIYFPVYTYSFVQFTIQINIKCYSNISRLKTQDKTHTLSVLELETQQLLFSYHLIKLSHSRCLNNVSIKGKNFYYIWWSWAAVLLSFAFAFKSRFSTIRRFRFKHKPNNSLFQICWIIFLLYIFNVSKFRVHLFLVFALLFLFSVSQLKYFFLQKY